MKFATDVPAARVQGRTRWLPSRRLRQGPVAVVMMVVVVLTAWMATGRTESHAATQGSAVLGAYAGTANPAGVNSFAQTVGTQIPYAMEFLSATSWSTISSPQWFLRQWSGSPYKMIWGVPMLPSGGGSTIGSPANGTSLATEATGAYNSYFASTAQALVAAGQGSSIIRLGWEFNGGWMTWAAGGQPANFVGAYQQIVTAMRSVPGQHFTFEWNPDIGEFYIGDLATYYPGNAYVDYVGLDVYDVEWGAYPGAQAEWQHMLTEPYGLNWLASFSTAQGKQIVFPEWGLGWGPGNNGGVVNAPGQETQGGDNPYFIQQMGLWIASHNVAEANYWDVSTSAVSSTQNPNSAAMMAQVFGGSAPPPTTTTTTGTAPSTTTTTDATPTTTTTTTPTDCSSSTQATVTSVSYPSPAGGGSQVTVLGCGFGTSYSNVGWPWNSSHPGYIGFTDGNGYGGTWSWGITGNGAPFEIDSWSPTEIVFTIPTPYLDMSYNTTYSVTPGTTAAFTITNALQSTTETQYIPISFTAPSSST